MKFVVIQHVMANNRHEVFVHEGLPEESVEQLVKRLLGHESYPIDLGMSPTGTAIKKPEEPVWWYSPTDYLEIRVMLENQIFPSQ